MSRLTRATTRRFLKRFLKPWATRPSISGTYGSGGTHLDLEFRTVLIEDGLDALLLPALDQAPVLGEEDGDPFAGDHVSVPPHPRVADQHHALLGVVVLAAAGRPHATVPGDDPDVPCKNHPLDTVGLAVRVHLHPIGVLDGVVLPGHDVALEDREPFPLH